MAFCSCCRIDNCISSLYQYRKKPYAFAGYGIVNIFHYFYFLVFQPQSATSPKGDENADDSFCHAGDILDIYQDCKI